MTYRLEFLPSAQKEWRKLGATVQTQLKKKLAERLENPHVTASRLSGDKQRYKIKLRQAGYRLVYEVRDTEIVVVVIAVGKRTRGIVYGKAAER
ncbi:MAG: type II toxin-antitoxin system mRNA interferase toxin, RelE/StbE family [Rhodobacteraceae bacterium]|nr:MAG: type II toxin-antitoxin system mRNA interferase toxin, RelE/StbE family [Paracoccaceae bacterium]